MQKGLSILLAVLGLAPAFAEQPRPDAVQAAPVPETTEIPPWNGAVQGRFLCALARDLAGNFWVGTEDSGLWRFDPREEAWRQYTTANGLAEDTVLALACDRQGRVWAGHNRAGVSVFNGQDWRVYGAGAGPLAGHVSGITINPVDGGVWLATSAGLACYRPAADDWQYVTRAAGLPASGIRRTAFAANGDLYAATEADGLAIARAAGGYRQWEKVAGVDAPPPAPAGLGLPSNCLNDVLVSNDGLVWVASAGGLAFSVDNGVTWQFRRGANWRKKAELAKPPAEHLPDTPAALSEDFVSCLAEGPGRQLWIGHRHMGAEALSEDLVTGAPDRDGAPVTVGFAREGDYVRALLCLPGGGVCVAGYGNGLVCIGSPVAPVPAANATAAPAFADLHGVLAERPLPPAKAPPALPRSGDTLPVTAEELAAAEREIRRAGVDESVEPWVVPLADDWSTRGAWLGRYGRYWACLASPIRKVVQEANFVVIGGSGYFWGAGEHQIESQVWRPGCYSHAPHTRDAGALEVPPAYLHQCVSQGRTIWQMKGQEAEWNDFESQPVWEREGANVCISLKVPKGTFILSVYAHNKDGHSKVGVIWDNRVRDYRISVRARQAGRRLMDVADFERWPELARGRIADFWGGVYKRFVVRGPQELAVQVNKNHSYMTTVAGAFLDYLDERPPPYFGDEEAFEKKNRALISAAREYFGQAAPRSGPPSADELGTHLEYLRLSNPRQWAELAPACSALLLRALAQQAAPLSDAQARIKASCLWQLGRLDEWEQEQRRQGLMPARAIEQAIRGDGGADNCSGEGRKYVQAYLKEHQGKPDFGTPAWVGQETVDPDPPAPASAPQVLRVPRKPAVEGDF